MDPDETLARMRRLVTGVLDGTADPDGELAELVDNLDEWIRKGGRLPQAWIDAHQGRV